MSLDHQRRGVAVERKADGRSAADPVRVRVSACRELREARVSLWARDSDARVIRLKERATWATPTLNRIDLGEGRFSNGHVREQLAGVLDYAGETR